MLFKLVIRGLDAYFSQPLYFAITVSLQLIYKLFWLIRITPFFNKTGLQVVNLLSINVLVC